MPIARRQLLTGAIGSAVGRLIGPSDANDTSDASGDFSQAALVRRVQQLLVEARAMYGNNDQRTLVGEDLYRRVTSGGCEDLPSLGEAVSPWNRLYWNRRFYSIFPNGAQIADQLWMIDHARLDSPPGDVDPQSFVDEHYSIVGRPRRPIMIAPDGVGLAGQRNTLRPDVATAGLWTAARDADRAQASRAAVSFAVLSGAWAMGRAATWLETSKREVPFMPSLVVLELSKASVLWASVEDLVGPNPLLPLVRLMSLGYVPFGETDGVFTIASKRPDGRESRT
jgi:hypothetical protein